MISLPYRLVLTSLLLAAAGTDAAGPPEARGVQDRMPVRPMYRQADSGWLERDVYRSAAGGGMAIQFLDILVGPGRNALVRRMPTGALLDIKAGTAVVTVGGVPHRTVPGVVIPIDQGQALAIDNREGERALVARLIRIASPR